MKTVVTIDEKEIAEAVAEYLKRKTGLTVTNVSIDAHPAPDAGDPRDTGPYVTASATCEPNPTPIHMSSLAVQRGD